MKLVNVDSISHPKGNYYNKREEGGIKDLDLNISEKRVAERRSVIKKVVIYFPILFLILGVASLLGSFLYDYFYKDRVLPGVYVLGKEMGGKYEGELRKIIREELENNKFIFRVSNKEERAEFSDMGLKIDFDRLVERGLKKGREGNILTNYGIRYRSLAYKIFPKYYQKYFGRIEVDLDYTIDDNKLKLFVKRLSEKMGSLEQNAGLVIKGKEVEVIPAKYGERIISESLEEQIRHSIAALRKGEKMVLGITTETITPHIREDNLKNSIQKAKKMIRSDIVLVYNDKNYKIPKEEIASWITFEEKNNTLEPKVDKAKIEAYLKNIAKEIDIPAIPRQIRIENGTKEIVKQEGKDGLLVDIAANSDLILKKVEAGEAATIGIITRIVKAGTKAERVLVADWTKYIEVDITNQKLIAYENKQPVFSDAVTTGRDGNSTPTGTFIVYGKTAIQNYRGGVPGTRDYYFLPNVRWSTWFNGAISIHEAYWRTSFGGQDYRWNGSRGCVNVRASTAKWIYDWAPIGTPVIVHY